MRQSKDKFYFGAYWGPRKENIEQVTTKVYRFLKALSEHHEIFRKLCLTGASKTEALQNVVSVDKDYLMSVFSKNLKKGDDKFSELGFLKFFWLCNNPDSSSRIMIDVGKELNRLLNFCVIELPVSDQIITDLLKPEQVVRMFELLVNVWDPEWVVLDSKKLDDLIEVKKRKIGWVSYHKDSKRQDNSSFVESVHPFGSIFMIEPPFDYRMQEKIEAIKKSSVS